MGKGAGMSHPIGSLVLVLAARRCVVGCLIGAVVLVGSVWLAYQLGVIAGTGL